MFYLILSSRHKGKLNRTEWVLYRRQNVVFVYTDEMSEDEEFEKVYLGV